MRRSNRAAARAGGFTPAEVEEIADEVTSRVTRTAAVDEQLVGRIVALTLETAEARTERGEIDAIDFDADVPDEAYDPDDVGEHGEDETDGWKDGFP